MDATRFFLAGVAAVLFAVPATAGGLCSLPHHPVAVGDVNQYRTTTRSLDADGYPVRTKSTVHTETVASVTSDSYVLRTDKLGKVTTSVWRCIAEGVRAEIPEYGGVTVEITGVSIPARLTVGDTWEQTSEARSQSQSRKMTSVNRVLKREEVVVPAGTFDALRVDDEIKIIVPGEPATVTRGGKWYAPGVGLVKSISVLGFPGEAEVKSIEVTVELLKRQTR